MTAKPGNYGLLATLLTAWLSWVVKYDAELRAALLTISIFIAIVTAAWWVRKWWRIIIEWKWVQSVRNRFWP